MSQGDIGLKVSQQGYSALSCIDWQLIFSSSFPALKIASMGTFSISGGAHDQTIVTHGLGYIPMFLVFTDRDLYQTIAGTLRLASPGLSQFFTVNNNSLKWQGSSRGGGAVTMTGYYIIFRRDLIQSYNGLIVNTTPELKNIKNLYGIKVARDGKDISSNDYRDFVIHSNTRTPIIHQSGFGTIGPSDTGEITIHHGLGYEPMFFAYAALDSFGDGRYQSLQNSFDSFAEADTQDIHLFIPYVCNYSYIILKDPILINS